MLLLTTVVFEESLEKRPLVRHIEEEEEEEEDAKTQLIILYVYIYIQSQNHLSKRSTKHRERVRENIRIK